MIKVQLHDYTRVVDWRLSPPRASLRGGDGGDGGEREEPLERRR